MLPKQVTESRVLLQSGNVTVEVDRICEIEEQCFGSQSATKETIRYRFDDLHIVETMRGERCVHNGIAYEPVL